MGVGLHPGDNHQALAREQGLVVIEIRRRTRPRQDDAAKSVNTSCQTSGPALAHTAPVGDDPVAVDGDFGGLNRHEQVFQKLAFRDGHRPGITPSLGEFHESRHIVPGENPDGVEVNVLGILGVDSFQPLQLSGADPSSRCPEEQEGGAAGLDYFG